MTIFDELKARGLLAQLTDEEEIKELINAGKATFYIGFDPTADSLHVGHFMALCLMKRLQEAGNKPIVFSEIGTRSCRGCVNVPGDFKTESPWDGQEQADYMDAAFSTFSKMPAWLGLSWWKWDETQHTRHHYSPDPLKDRGFTICGKPAAAVMRKWAKGWRL